MEPNYVCIIAQIANFAVLRRHLGMAVAGRLAEDVAGVVAKLIPDSTVVATARDRIEITAAAADRGVLSAWLAMIDNAFETAFVVDDEPYAIDLVIGAGIVGIGQHDAIRLIDEAEQAVEDARVARAPVVRGVGDIDTAIPDREALARDLRLAIGKGELFLHYQPKVHLRRNRVESVEALIRWRHPVRGLIMPGEFIGIAEESRDIIDLTVWTIQQVIRDQRALAREGHDVTAFINISGSLLSDARFVRRACALVKSSGARIGFEITETAVIREPEIAIAHLHEFAAIGIDIAIDDYGAGLSSLAYLKKLPARELKIDKLFVTQLTSSNRDPLIVRSTIDLAHALEMEVVAEGVETPAALALLTVMGCDIAQGYFISRPIDLPALLDFLGSDAIADLDPKRAMLPDLARAFGRA
ncbi:EAL domain-containing protein [Sphingomonas sp. CFBP 8760]|uniref:EAL domain-containing protein n=1 Tax=Sphingomonas sp. CFBP 8760 TaxID=2775282 RepID=UPI001782BFC5|nr:EAL domain-containing protein [Sphingomonas sp. CFBP 8760]MBD8545826.1 EAL domain-containing protein [Sphingomonas sp. CFBP 8760]